MFSLGMVVVRCQEVTGLEASRLGIVEGNIREPGYVAGEIEKCLAIEPLVKPVQFMLQIPACTMGIENRVVVVAVLEAGRRLRVTGDK